MGTQKPGEWANSLIARFEEQVNIILTLKFIIKVPPIFGQTNRLSFRL